MIRPTRRLVLLAALMASSAAAVWVGDDEQTTAESRGNSARGSGVLTQAEAEANPRLKSSSLPSAVAERPAGRPGSREPVEGRKALDLDLSRLDARRDPAATIRDAFEPRSWTVPPPVVSQVSPPTAPPLPFKYIGKIMEDGGIAVFISKNDRNLVVREGDMIDDSYRVAAISPSAMKLVYLPLGIEQTLPVGNAP